MNESDTTYIRIGIIWKGVTGKHSFAMHHYQNCAFFCHALLTHTVLKAIWVGALIVSNFGNFYFSIALTKRIQSPRASKLRGSPFFHSTDWVLGGECVIGAVGAETALLRFVVPFIRASAKLRPWRLGVVGNKVAWVSYATALFWIVVGRFELVSFHLTGVGSW